MKLAAEAYMTGRGITAQDAHHRFGLYVFPSELCWSLVVPDSVLLALTASCRGVRSYPPLSLSPPTS